MRRRIEFVYDEEHRYKVILNGKKFVYLPINRENMFSKFRDTKNIVFSDLINVLPDEYRV